MLRPICALAAATLLFTAAAAAGDDDFFTHLHGARAMVNVTVSPGRAGPVEIAIELETPDAEPLAAKAVTVRLSEPGRGLQTYQAERAGDERWHAKIPMLQSGRWLLGVGVAISDADRIDIEAPILIK